MEPSDPAKILPDISYWNSHLLEPPFSPLDLNRYITFDTDQGGLSNIRLAFEYVVAIAAITGRTLVLPPPEPWYLLNFGPKHVGNREGLTDFTEIMDIPALQEIIPVISTNEFILESAKHLNIPHALRDEFFFTANAEGRKPWEIWKEWLLNNTHIAEKWAPYHTLICFPDQGSIDTDRLSETYRDGRELIEYLPMMSASPVIHFPSNAKYRSLGPVATMLAPGNDELPKLTRRLIKNHVRYHPKIFEIASQFISQLGCNKYSALHIRRNDFQYKQTRAGAETSWNNISKLIDDPSPFYIATDEVDEEFKEFFRAKKSTYFWNDLLENYSGPEIPEKYIGPIEQLVCVGAHRFIGTDLSTFSSYIVRMRGYCDAPDTASYYHTQQYKESIEELDPETFRGRNYLQENPLYWRDC